MKNWLLGWNIVVTVILFVALFSGCSNQSPEQANRQAIDILTKGVNQQGQTIQQMQNQMNLLQAQTQSAMQQLTTSLQSYVQQYVAAHGGK